MNSDGPIAYCHHISRTFIVRGDDVSALDDIDLVVERGRLTAIAGPSGSGKSTLLSILGCLDRPTTGRVVLAGHELTVLSRRQRRTLRRTTVATMLPQPAHNLLLARSGTHNLTLAARQRHAGVDGIAELIETLDIGAFVGRPCNTMSGGEQQRVALACALAGSTPLVLADEPTGSLDATSAAHVIAALVRATEAGATVVTASHDPAVIQSASAVVRLDHGRRVS